MPRGRGILGDGITRDPGCLIKDDPSVINPSPCHQTSDVRVVFTHKSIVTLCTRNAFGDTEAVFQESLHNCTPVADQGSISMGGGGEVTGKLRQTSKT